MPFYVTSRFLSVGKLYALFFIMEYIGILKYCCFTCFPPTVIASQKMFVIITLNTILEFDWHDWRLTWNNHQFHTNFITSRNHNNSNLLFGNSKTN